MFSLIRALIHNPYLPPYKNLATRKFPMNFFQVFYFNLLLLKKADFHFLLINYFQTNRQVTLTFILFNINKSTQN